MIRDKVSFSQVGIHSFLVLCVTKWTQEMTILQEFRATRPSVLPAEGLPQALVAMANGLMKNASILNASPEGDWDVSNDETSKQ